MNSKLRLFILTMVIILDPKMTKLVYSSSDEDGNIFSAQAMHDICRSEDTLIQPYLMNILKSRQIRKKFFADKHTFPDIRCRSHSLPWYILLYLGKDSCFDIDDVDMLRIKDLLTRCFPLYQSGALKDNSPPPDNDPMGECYKQDYVFTIFEYLIDSNFVQKSESLQYTMLIAHTLQKGDFPFYFISVFDGHDMTTGDVEVVGFFRKLGKKLAMFAHYVSSDLWLFTLAVSLILFIMLIYLQSVALVIATLINIAFSFSIAYFFYHIVMGIEFFPFLNLLSGIVIIAVAADDVFVYYDTWHKIKNDRARLKIGIQQPDGTELAIVASETFKHATVAIFVTSFTTAAAFFANCVSSITVIKCFGLFSGMVILANFILMITWTPTVIIIIERLSKKYTFKKCTWLFLISDGMHKFERQLFDKYIPLLISKLWFVCIIVFTGLGISGFFAIFYWPKLHLPTNTYVQLFTRGTGMLMEKYEKDLQYKFPFAARTQQEEMNKMKVQFVWGVHPKDNGHVFDSDPYHSASLIADDSFNMTSIDAQVWLMDFCQKIMNQSFVDSPRICAFDFYLDILRSNCGGSEYSMMLLPCCGIKSFPVDSGKLEFCLPILDGVGYLILTNKSKHSSHSELELYDVSGRPIFDRKTNKPSAFFMNIFTNLKATSAYSDMIKVYDKMNDYANDALATTPVGLQHGWWGAQPDLILYDLQKSLEYGVFYSISASLAVTLAMMLITSLNVLVTIIAAITITFVIASTLGCLVLSGWVLNILESLTLSLAVGLSIDFTIHYGVAYKLSKKNTSKEKMHDSVSKVGSAVAMAALTTFAAGAAMMPTRIIAYKELGCFLMLVMVFSWSFSTFFFQAICRVVGPTGNFCQISCNNCRIWQHIMKNFMKVFRCKKAQTQNIGAEMNSTSPSLYPTQIDSDDELLADYLNELEYADDVPALR